MEPELQVIYLLSLSKAGYVNGDPIPNNRFGDIIRNTIKNAPKAYYGRVITVENVRDLLLNILYQKADRKEHEQRFANDLQDGIEARQKCR